MYLQTNFNSDMDQVRSSVSVADLLHVNKLSGASNICQQLVLQCSIKLDPLNSDVRWLIKVSVLLFTFYSIFLIANVIKLGII